MPLLPEGHRDAERRKESRIKVIAQNAANEEKRYTLRLQAWTEVYTALKISTETTAPVLSRVLRDECDLSKQGVTGGYFDGPRAWAIVCAVLTGGLRSEVDKDYYRHAERLQRASPLADGSSASDYSKRAMAFLIHINPYLAQPYNADDTTSYLIGLMRKSLKTDGRRIKHELTQEGKLHDHMHVVQRCRALVHEEQKAAPPTPAFVVTDDGFPFDLDTMMRTTGR